MKKVIILFSADKWHTKFTKNIEGVFSTKEKSIEYLKESNHILNDSDYIDLQLQNQTQMLSTNFVIEEYDVDLKP